ncbi:unnamed protein product [Calicophoron daubneyi]|uniref:Micrococcal nuclease n=1 Tax=Calicophoron daubneyi TaxID=300641 RepID=A0AAV2SXI9_CALDB
MSVPSVFSGVVKQVQSGDSIVIRDRPIDGPPPERTIVLSNISCGRVARKPTPNNPAGTAEDPFAWQAREFVRAKLIGKEVCYTVENELPSGRTYGNVYLGRSTKGENIALLLVQEGLGEVRKLSPALAEKNALYQELLAAEATAKSLGKGKWSADQSRATREIVWSIDDPRGFVDKNRGTRLRGIVEYVRDGSSFQITLLPSEEHGVYYNVVLSISGIKAPAVRYEDGKPVGESFGSDAQFFVESRLLQREVAVLLESVINQNFIGSVLHPNGNIAEVLLREGLARCIDWNLNLVSIPNAAEAYRAAERCAKERRLRLWKDYQPTSAAVEVPQTHDANKIAQGMSFSGQVIEVGNGDNVSVKCTDGVVRKFFLASVRPPRLQVSPREGEDGQGPPQRNRIRPLYDVPHVFEAREELRAFVGKPVTVHVDYIQPKTATTVDERACATIKCGTINVAESLVSKGLAQVIRYRNANDSRTASYAELLSAEEQAQIKGLGLHSKQEPPVHRVADLTGNAAKSRQFLPFLQRTPRIDAVVEFVVHASRMRVYLPRETCVITLLLAGIQCPRRGRVRPDGTEEPDMPMSGEAFTFTKELCMQRDVEVAVETMDRAGNFVGWMFVDGGAAGADAPVTTAEHTKSGKKKKKVAAESNVSKTKTNLSVLLVSKGLATVLQTAATESSPYYHDLVKAESSAKEARVGLWALDEFVKQWEADANALSETANTDGADDDRLLPGGGVQEYLDDLSMLNINGQTGESAQNNQDLSKIQWRPVQVTALSKPSQTSQGLRFFVQYVSDSATIVQISRGLNVQQHPPPVPGYVPAKNELCAACFSMDNCWYRARAIRKTAKNITVQFVDFGNEESIEMADAGARLSPLPTSALANIPPQAHEYRLGLVQLPPDAVDRGIAERVFTEQVENKEVLLGVLFDSIPCANETVKPVPGVALRAPASVAPLPGSSTQSAEVDIAHNLLEEGLVCVEPMHSQLLKRLPRDLHRSYLEAQAKAKKERKNIWRYGDFRKDDGQI